MSPTTTSNGAPAPDRERSIAAEPSTSPAAVAPGPAADANGGANGAAGSDRALARSTAAPVGATTDAGRLAALSGGALVAAPDGRSSVVFSSPGRQLARYTRTTGTGTAHSASPPPAPTTTAATASIDVDDLYDQIAARLRRELLLDRERAGELP